MELIAVVDGIATAVAVSDNALLRRLTEPLIDDEKPVAVHGEKDRGVRSFVDVIPISAIRIEGRDRGAGNEVGIVSHLRTASPLRRDRRPRHFADERYTVSGSYRLAHVSIVLRSDESHRRI
jgi:hypothetical protein